MEGERGGRKSGGKNEERVGGEGEREREREKGENVPLSTLTYL